MSFRTQANKITDQRDSIRETADKIIAALESGVKPWVRPWDEGKFGATGGPFNPLTKHAYRGINILILGMHAAAFLTGDPRFMTYRQADEAGYQVRKGEKSTTIFFSKPLEVEDDKSEDGKNTVRLLKSFPVFHASQIDGVPAYQPPTVDEALWTRPEATDIILKAFGVPVRAGGDKAYYSPLTDHIQMPPENAFRGPPEWAATALHKLGHATRPQEPPRP